MTVSASVVEVPVGFKTSDVGVIPSDWNVKVLADCAEIRSGVAKNSNLRLRDPIRVHYLRVANVQDGYLDLSEMSEIEIERGRSQEILGENRRRSHERRGRSRQTWAGLHMEW